LHLGVGGAQIRAALVCELCRGVAGAAQRFGPLEVGREFVPRGLSVREICFRLLNLGGFAGGLEIGELRLG
jgi:hypothetical protein